MVGGSDEGATSFDRFRFSVGCSGGYAVLLVAGRSSRIRHGLADFFLSGGLCPRSRRVCGCAASGEVVTEDLAGGEAWVAGQSNARILVMSPTGHFPFIEQQEETINAIQIFLDGNWPEGAESRY